MKIIQFPGVRLEVIQLGRGGQDVFEVVSTDTDQGRPAVHSHGGDRFYQHGSVWLRRLLTQVDAVHFLGHLLPQQMQNRGNDIDQAGLPLDHLPLGNCFGGMPDHRDMQRCVIDKERVRLLAMFSQAFTVVGGVDDQRTIVDA